MVPPTVFPSYAADIARVSRMERLERIGWRTFCALGTGRLTSMDTHRMHGPALKVNP